MLRNLAVAEYLVCQQVCFVPGTRNKLLSASVDGLMCLFDTSGDINDDDHLNSVRLTAVFFNYFAAEQTPFLDM